jgi:hypothetical protein
MKGFHPRTFFSKAWLPALSACLALAACRGKTLDPDAGTEDEGTTSAGTLKEKTSLVNSSAALKWPSVNEETRQSGLTQRAIGNGGIAVMPILQGDRSPANWDFCYENNTPSATRCQWASSDILAKVGQRPTIIQAFQLNVYTSGKRYNGTIGSPTTGTSDANWTIELQGAWIKTAVLGFDSASGALTLTSGRTELIAGANPGACALSNVNAVGHDTGHAKVLTGIHLMDEANPDPTGGNGGAAVLNNFYVAGRLRAGKVWVAGMIPAPKSGDPYYVDFVPAEYGSTGSQAVFGNQRSSFNASGTVASGVLPLFEDKSEDKAKRVITGVCIQGRKVSGPYSRPLFLHALFRFNKPEMATIK